MAVDRGIFPGFQYHQAQTTTESPQLNFHSLLNGGVVFAADDEYLAFRFRLLNALMLVSAFFTAVFLLLEGLGVNHLGRQQTTATALDCAFSLFLLLVLRGHRHRFEAVAILFIVANFLTYLSALIFVVNDELRVIWFYLMIFVVYILLGRVAGVRLTAVTVLTLLLVNRALPVPFSGNAMTTLLVSLCVTSAIAYAYTSRAISFFEQLTERNRLLRELASRDPLTGLFNARAFYETGNQLMSLGRRQRSPFSLLFVDLDHFKLINDRFGHEAGDRVLQEVAACLARQMRGSDLLGRIGGEEFSVFLPDTPVEGAAALAEKLRATLAALSLVVHGKELRITASIGVACERAVDAGIKDIQQRADQAMYRAKQAGRNRVEILAAA